MAYRYINARFSYLARQLSIPTYNVHDLLHTRIPHPSSVPSDLSLHRLHSAMANALDRYSTSLLTLNSTSTNHLRARREVRRRLRDVEQSLHRTETAGKWISMSTQFAQTTLSDGARHRRSPVVNMSPQRCESTTRGDGTGCERARNEGKGGKGFHLSRRLSRASSTSLHHRT